MSKPKIGIVGYKSSDGNSFGAGIAYLDFISQFGDAIIVMPHQVYPPDLDALVLPGGPDLRTSTYGEVPSFYTGSPDAYRQHFFDNCLGNYIDAGIPIIGICLGFQQLNVHFGGSLTQNFHYHAQSPSRWTKAHDIISTEEAHSLDLGLARKFEVNSHHHQGVLLHQLAQPLVPLAIAANEEYIDEKSLAKVSDNEKPFMIVEAFKHESLPIIGFQWHPEEWRDHFSTTLIKALLNLP